MNSHFLKLSTVIAIFGIAAFVLMTVEFEPPETLPSVAVISPVASAPQVLKPAVNKMELETAFHRISIERNRLEFLEKGWPKRFSVAAKQIGITASEARQNVEIRRPYFDFVDRTKKVVLLITPQGHLFSYDVAKKTWKSINSNLPNIIEETAWLDPSTKWVATNSIKQQVVWLVEPGARDLEIIRNSAIGDVVLVAANRFEGDCMRQVIYQAPLAELTESGFRFQVLFKTDDCATRHPSNGISRLMQLNDHEIIASIGQGFENNGTAEQKAVFGSSIRVNLVTGEGKVFTRGHRVPQGLGLVADGTILMAEHGPRGGDEINALVGGKHYGWPDVSYGIGYDLKPQHFNRSHRSFEEPIFYFSPSIAISDLLVYRNTHFRRWQGNILVTSLKDKAIHRLHFIAANLAVRSVERIDVGCRIRDIETDAEGIIYISCDNKEFLTIRKSDPDYF